jgi:hypothetical protein
LGFLEEENCKKTYGTLLEECVYSRELELLPKNKLKTVRRPFGKNLKEFLQNDFEKDFEAKEKKSGFWSKLRFMSR